MRGTLLKLSDPAGLPRAPKAPDIFDHAPDRNAGMPQVGPLKHVSDDLLIATQVAVGMPRWAADQVRYHPGARFLALRLWCDVQDADEGDLEAKARVDYYRETFAQLRRLDLISDRPDMSAGLMER